MEVSWAWWVGFNLGVLALLGFDLLVLNRARHAPSFKEALALTAFWTALAVAFGAGIGLGWVGRYPADARGPACWQYFTAFSLEESLSLDNVFVWVLLFRHFHVKAAHQRGVLSYGMVVAMAMRAVLILGGVAFARHFSWVFYLFGAYLLYAAVKMWRPQRSPAAPGRNPAWELIQRWMHTTEDNPDGKIIVHRHGRWSATPLLAVLLTLELTDLTFALDSVPAVLAVTTDSFIAYTSNILAVLGLRAMFFLLQHVIERCWLLHYGLAVLLGFIGLKMLTAHFFEIPLGASLVFIALVLGGSIAGSWLIPRPRHA
ncbi:MAG TPA: TerC/Alx family metal homeostasis membrane protein [Opitutales bacterium]|nr:TerC/Alx family metal homeostasis membrane protein [Opitutales bacterium]